jgi:SARP family transcriptional regulator, regulator of embCAB operon
MAPGHAYPNDARSEGRGGPKRLMVESGTDWLMQYDEGRASTQLFDQETPASDSWERSSVRAQRISLPADLPAWRLCVLGGFILTRSEACVNLPRGSERLLAFLALQQHTTRRATVSGTLWRGSDERHALAALRSALARLHGIPLVESRPQTLRLRDGLAVDIVEARALAHRLVDDEARCSDIALTSISCLAPSLLPGWNDAWLTIEAEDWRQLRLHALEALSAAFLRVERSSDAVTAAVAAVEGDPLRESARFALVKAYLGQNNYWEAVRECRHFRDLLLDELGVTPSVGFARLEERVRD